MAPTLGEDGEGGFPLPPTLTTCPSASSPLPLLVLAAWHLPPEGLSASLQGSLGHWRLQGTLGLCRLGFQPRPLPKLAVWSWASPCLCWPRLPHPQNKGVGKDDFSLSASQLPRSSPAVTSCHSQHFAVCCVFF